MLDMKSDFEAFLSIQLETVEDIYREFYNQVFNDGSNCRVAEVVRGHRGTPPKRLDSDENFKPEHTLLCHELRFVAI